MNESTPPTTNFAQTRRAAEAVLTHKVNGQTITMGDKEMFPDVKVQLDTGMSAEGWIDDNKKFSDRLTLTIEGNSVDMSANAVRKAIEKTLHDIPFIDELVRTGTHEEEIHDVKTELAKLKDAGAKIPESLFKWAGFDQENGKDYEVSEHMVSVTANSHGVHTTFHLPSHLPDGIKTDDITNYITKHESGIKDVLAEKIVKIKGGDKDDIRQQLEPLEFVVHDHGEHVNGNKVTTGGFDLDIMSPAQKAAKEEAHIDSYEAPKADPELEKTNPLQALETLDLSKVISSALQKGGGDEANKIIPALLGAKDVLHKIEKALKPLKEERPDLEHNINEVLNSSIFERGRKWDRDDDGKFKKHGLEFKVIQNKPTDNLPLRNQLTVSMIVPENGAAQIIQKLAAIELPQAQQTNDQQFMSVDSMEVLGAHSPNPELHKQMNMVIAPIVGQRMTPEQSADTIKPYAEKLIALVEDMFKDKSEALAAHMDNETIKKNMTDLLNKIDQAHQTVMEGVQEGSKQAELAASSHTHAAPNTAKTPSPTMLSVDWIQQLAKQTKGQGTLALGA